MRGKQNKGRRRHGLLPYYITLDLQLSCYLQSLYGNRTALTEQKTARSALVQKAQKRPAFMNNAYKIYRLKGNRLVKIERWIFLSHLETVKVPSELHVSTTAALVAAMIRGQRLT